MMKSEIINNIQHQIKPHLNQNQYIQQNRILKNEFKDIQITTTKNTENLNNKELLTLFLKAKKKQKDAHQKPYNTTKKYLKKYWKLSTKEYSEQKKALKITYDTCE